MSRIRVLSALCLAVPCFLVGCRIPEPPPARQAQPIPDAGTPAASHAVLASLANLSRGAVLEPDPSIPQARRSEESGGLSGQAATGGARVEFPLRHTKVRAEVAGNIARVELQQLYVNPSDTRLEAVYAFPLPANAAVTDMYLRIGKRIVYSEVKRKEEARETYERARREGRAAALTEQERPNLFTQSVANIPPGETVAVVLRYVHEVPYDDGRYLFVFPTTVGPRYIPGNPTGRQGAGWAPDTDRVGDASRITPPVMNPDARSGHDLEIVVRLKPGKAFRVVASRSHRILHGLDGDGARLVALAEQDRVPNKDFVLAYRPEGAMPQAHAVVQHEKGERYLMLFLQPPAQVEPALVRPKEVVFLLDKSGSMQGLPIETAKALMLKALRRLGPDDTFQLVAFDGASQKMSGEPLPNRTENVAAAERWLASLSGGGGTEMLSGIRDALAPPADPRRLRMVVFCTDGFIGNEREIIDAVAKTRDQARVFGFGVGSSVNRYLLEGVARAGRGAADVVTLRDDPQEAVDRLFSRLDRPLLTDLRVSFEGLTVEDVLPAQLPDLFAGQPLVVVGRYKGGNAAGTITLRGMLGSLPHEVRVPVEAQAAEEDAPVVGTLWARRRIEELTFQEEGGPGEQARGEIVKLGLRFKLVTQYTSFVAVERELRVDPAVPLTQVVVPNEMPEGVSAEGIFGEQAATAQVLPARVKPGDPEIRIRAPRSVGAVKVTLPFDRQERDASFDPATGDFVLRFLVPPAWPDGSYDAKLALHHADGTVETQQAAIRVDTTPAAIAILKAPSSARPGERLLLHLKPAIALPRLAQLASRETPGGLANALKGAMEVKEVLVRAPWGELVTAKMRGAFGSYVAELTVPERWPAGTARIEIVASDAAGNVARRGHDLEIGQKPRWALAALLALTVLALAGAVRAWLRAETPRRAP